jgi:hypothetical protein
MFLIIMGWIFALILLYGGWMFYRSMDWEEPAEPSPDLRAMRKKEVELLHIQDVLMEAGEQGKISKQVIEEYQRYCETEIQGMKSIEKAWRERPKK